MKSVLFLFLLVAIQSTKSYAYCMYYSVKQSFMIGTEAFPSGTIIKLCTDNTVTIGGNGYVSEDPTIYQNGSMKYAFKTDFMGDAEFLINFNNKNKTATAILRMQYDHSEMVKLYMKEISTKDIEAAEENVRILRQNIKKSVDEDYKKYLEKSQKYLTNIDDWEYGTYTQNRTIKTKNIAEINLIIDDLIAKGDSLEWLNDLKDYINKYTVIFERSENNPNRYFIIPFTTYCSGLAGAVNNMEVKVIPKYNKFCGIYFTTLKLFNPITHELKNTLFVANSLSFTENSMQLNFSDDLNNKIRNNTSLNKEIYTTRGTPFELTDTIYIKPNSLRVCEKKPSVGNIYLDSMVNEYPKSLVDYSFKSDLKYLDMMQKSRFSVKINKIIYDSLRMSEYDSVVVLYDASYYQVNKEIWNDIPTYFASFWDNIYYYPRRYDPFFSPKKGFSSMISSHWAEREYNVYTDEQFLKNGKYSGKPQITIIGLIDGLTSEQRGLWTHFNYKAPNGEYFETSIQGKSYVLGVSDFEVVDTSTHSDTLTKNDYYMDTAIVHSPILIEKTKLATTLPLYQSVKERSAIVGNNIIIPFISNYTSVFGETNSQSSDKDLLPWLQPIIFSFEKPNSLEFSYTLYEHITHSEKEAKNFSKMRKKELRESKKK